MILIGSTLTLHLTFHWYDMIASGEKREEYRLIKPYNIKRFCYFWNSESQYRDDCKGVDCQACFDNTPDWCCQPYEYVTFYRGYTSERMTFEVKSVEYGNAKPEWASDELKDKLVFIIKMGNKVE